MAQEATPLLKDYQPTLADERECILAGLQADRKRLSPKYFYDQRGSELFERICQLPEYYPTRTELGIMRSHRAAIAAAVGARACVIEFGSGSSVKIRLLLDILGDVVAYVPVEISGDYLKGVAGSLAADFPDIEIRPVCADFTQPFELPKLQRPARRRVAYFPGSTIGNFEPADALEVLRVMRRQVGDDGALLIGVDLQKDPAILERAYNDAAGVTAEFNLNLLRRLNRELGANFELARFRHRADYNAGAGRIEMYLISERAQQVRLGGETIDFAAGERILTEYSHKYTLQGFADLARDAALRVECVWTDDNGLFSVQYLAATGGR
jgi:L-histidine Nalpha-methyltransferase